MKKIIAAAIISGAVLVGCSSQSQPTPTVTITEQAPSLNQDDGAVVGQQMFIDFVKENGGIYGSVAQESDILDLGNTICDSLAKGLSEDEVLYALSSALVENDMNNEDGIKFGAALMVGAQNYLCNYSY
jgi:PBP1b-binding outer membrane lipoprotein LpoB